MGEQEGKCEAPSPSSENHLVKGEWREMKMVACPETARPGEKGVEKGETLHS